MEEEQRRSRELMQRVERERQLEVADADPVVGADVELDGADVADIAADANA